MMGTGGDRDRRREGHEMTGTGGDREMTGTGGERDRR